MEKILDFVKESKYIIIKDTDAAWTAESYFGKFVEELEDNEDLFLVIRRDTGIQYAAFDGGDGPAQLIELQDDDYTDSQYEWYRQWAYNVIRYESPITPLSDSDITTIDGRVLYNSDDPIIYDQKENIEDFFPESKHFYGILKACAYDTVCAALICGAQWSYTDEANEVVYYFL